MSTVPQAPSSGVLQSSAFDVTVMAGSSIEEYNTGENGFGAPKVNASDRATAIMQQSPNSPSIITLKAGEVYHFPALSVMVPKSLSLCVCVCVSSVSMEEVSRPRPMEASNPILEAACKWLGCAEMNFKEEKREVQEAGRGRPIENLRGWC
mmetsp:Transcript_8008/g.14906  ORF Transcript_8008/g.14906 Transcript_8008/m.14906 type:complete len:151 (+) Transcript_8008:513-965(+)